MTKEQLLVPRYKVIARWPNMGDDGFFENQIFELTEGDSRQRYTRFKGMYVYDAWFDGYPHLFKRLEWWRDRKREEMPEYVRYGEWDRKHAIYKVKYWEIERCNGGFTDTEDFLPVRSYRFYPATESEYIAYINQQK